MSKKYCVIIPTYNSRKHLPLLIEKIREDLPGITLIIIDDCSTDFTDKQVLVDESCIFVKHAKNKGKGAAIMTGISIAQKHNLKYAVFIDSDLQHDPAKIKEMIALHRAENPDLILGKRTLEIGQMPLMRVLSNLITSLLISLRTGQKISDSQCGFRLLNLKKINIQNYYYNGFQTESEMLIKLLDNGISYQELPIPTQYDNEKSSINHILDTLKFIKLYFHSFFWNKKGDNR